MIDYHVHPDFSPDAQGTVEDFCAQAERIGLDGLCFTTHYEPDPVRADRERVVVAGQPRPVDSDWPKVYLAAVNKARLRFPSLVVQAGVEIGYEPGLEGVICDFLTRYQFDFVLGAVHCLDHVAITASDELDYCQRELVPLGGEAVARRYCRHLAAAANSQLFDCLAHVDIYRKYLQPLLGEPFVHAINDGMSEVLKQVARSGTGIEVNSSALRRGSDEPYPAKRLLVYAVEYGVRFFTIGSDAHRPDDLGTGLTAAQDLLRGLGVKPVCFNLRQPVAPEPDVPTQDGSLVLHRADLTEQGDDDNITD
ncbi:MAG: histidinol-phosphatase HisJ family protein [candidate division WOR-3 bacterium]